MRPTASVHHPRPPGPPARRDLRAIFCGAVLRRPERVLVIRVGPNMPASIVTVGGAAFVLVTTLTSCFTVFNQSTVKLAHDNTPSQRACLCEGV